MQLDVQAFVEVAEEGWFVVRAFEWVSGQSEQEPELQVLVIEEWVGAFEVVESAVGVELAEEVEVAEDGQRALGAVQAVGVVEAEEAVVAVVAAEGTGMGTGTGNSFQSIRMLS